MTSELIRDHSVFVPLSDHSQILDLSRCLALGLLARPGGSRTISLLNSDVLSDGLDDYPIVNSIPVLLPKCPSRIEFGPDENSPEERSLQLYYSLSKAGHSGEINSPSGSVPTRRHQYRLSKFCRNLSGICLDVGCDDPELSSQFFPKSCKYVGLDPFTTDGSFRIKDLAEWMPFTENSFDVVVFNTSLDHILDHHTALEEACRVLRVGGELIVASYAWTMRASLLTDDIHFHHFCEFEIVGAVAQYFEVEEVVRYEDPKEADHRFGIYVKAVKA